MANEGEISRLREEMVAHIGNSRMTFQRSRRKWGARRPSLTMAGVYSLLCFLGGLSGVFLFAVMHTPLWVSLPVAVGAILVTYGHYFWNYVYCKHTVDVWVKGEHIYYAVNYDPTSLRFQAKILTLENLTRDWDRDMLKELGVAMRATRKTSESLLDLVGETADVLAIHRQP